MAKMLKTLEREVKKTFLRLLTAAAGMQHSPAPVPVTGEIESVLVMRIDGKMGNMILTLPLVQAVKQIFEKARVTLLIDGSQRQLLENNPYIDNCIIYDWQSILFLPWRWNSFIKSIRRYDLVIECSNPGSFSVSHAFLLVLTKGRFRLGFERGISHKFLNLLVPLNERQHFREMMLDLVRIFRKPFHANGPYIFLTEKEKQMGKQIVEFNRFQSSNADVKSPIVGIWIGARHQKQLPVEHYFRVGDNLRDKGNACVYYFFGTEEKELYDRIKSETERNVRFFTSVRLLAAALVQCRLIISGDTGPLHLSAALGRPTLGLFNLTNVRAYGYDNGADLKTLYIPDCEDPIDAVIDASLKMLRY